MKTDASSVLRANGVIAAAATDCGIVRDHNEDVFYINPETGIFLVVDGVGGQAAGEVAARIAADRIPRRVERQDAPVHVRVREAITLANREILLKAQSDPELAGMACVLTLAVLDGEELTVGHVGDSRLYRLDARGISKVTHDHSPVGELEDAREISETDAMRDVRRNEVYRDVGSEPRDPEADDFIELIRTRFDRDSALLLCSDGLTDMLPALEVNRIVRLHAGDPDAAVTALIAAANQVGGKDNITAIVVEGADFRRTPDGGRAYPPPPPESQVPTLPLADPPQAQGSSATEVSPAVASDSRLGDGVRAVMGSRGVALIGGVVLGLLVPFGLTSVPENVVTRMAERVLVVGGHDAGAFDTIGAALADAQPGDVVEVEAGEYPEAIDLPPGVELRASKPGTAVLVARADSENWTAINANGPGGTIRGFRIVGTRTLPMVHGVVVGGDGITVDDVTLQGTIGVGVDIVGSDAVVRSSRFEDLIGTGVRLARQGATLRQNVFRSAGQASPAAIETVGAVTASFNDNVFMHFGHVVEPDARADDLLGRDNFVILATPKR